VVATELTNTITDESLKAFVEMSKKMEALRAEDIANAILYAVESPAHVNVNEILIRPTTQER
jgi:NADP-dependent 3-hydroxy acid dehydrogenase YdfG